MLGMTALMNIQLFYLKYFNSKGGMGELGSQFWLPLCVSAQLY